MNNDSQINGTLHKSQEYDNPVYESDEPASQKPTDRSIDLESRLSNAQNEVQCSSRPTRKTWNNSIEFLMSCIAVSVGFGNIWRFPFVAYENGGGAFIIPYIILLFLVGKPFYFLEMIIGQFSGNSSVRVWHLSPAFVGVGWAQFCSTFALVSYYSSLMALTLYYLIASFSYELPWARCKDEWNEYCVDSTKDSATRNYNATNLSSLLTGSNYRSSAELYFSKVVLNEKESIDDGIGLPGWKLTLCLLGSWLSICIVICRGIRSSGKSSYFFAIFPYIVLLSLLIRAVTLEGAINGILFFITPNWSKLLYPKVWYAAVTQCFFSLSICFGFIISYSSHNEFRHNIYRDVTIITGLDTMTSLIAGFTTFGILGNLAHEMGIEDIGTVVRSGTGLAFISYPDAIAKFTVLPQLFSALFFVMMFVLGVGSAMGMTTSIVMVIKEKYPYVKIWQIVIPICTIGFLVALVYVTPGGQFILNLVDYYGTSFIVFILAFFEIIGVTWMYGLENFLNDIEFMLQKRLSAFWRICWLIVTPMILLAIFIYTIATLPTLTYGGREYPALAYTAGQILLCIGAGQLPLWMLIHLFKNRKLPLLKMVKTAFMPSVKWGPQEMTYRIQWLQFKEEKVKQRKTRKQSVWKQKLNILFRIKPK